MKKSIQVNSSQFKSIQVNSSQFKSIPLILVCLIFLFSCNENSDLLPDIIPENDSAGFEVVDGYLVIDNIEDVPKIIKNFQNNNFASSNLRKTGFTTFRSLMDIYHYAVEEETKYFDSLEKIGEARLVKENVHPNCDFVRKNAKLFKFDEEGWFEPNVPISYFAYILNVEGIVVIGEDAFLHQGNNIYKSKDVSLLREFLTFGSSNIDGVEEIKLQSFRGEVSSNARMVLGTFSVNSCTGTAGRYRVRLYEDIVQTTIGILSYKLDHFFTVKSFRKTTFGWDRNFATGALSGQVSAFATWGQFNQLIQANGPQSIIGYVFATYFYSNSNRPFIYNSQGQGWGRDGCTCTYNGVYN